MDRHIISFFGFFGLLGGAVFAPPGALAAALATATALWGGGLEAVVGLAALVAGVPALVWLLLPRWTAVCSHDGQRWLAVDGVWSSARGVAAGDLEQFSKQWLGQSLTGRFVTTDQARLPVSPVARYHHIELWGATAGIYYVVGVRVFDPALLDAHGRSRRAPARHEERDEMIPL